MFTLFRAERILEYHTWKESTDVAAEIRELRLEQIRNLPSFLAAILERRVPEEPDYHGSQLALDILVDNGIAERRIKAISPERKASRGGTNAYEYRLVPQGYRQRSFGQALIPIPIYAGRTR